MQAADTMNRLLAKKKTKDVESPVLEVPSSRGGNDRPSTSSNAQPAQSIPKKRGWRKKKVEAEPEPEIDLSMALPSADSFRTSLIMSNLSTRFSMLRDQDDPLSLLGKANDDSVLAPRRRSRLGDWGYNASSLSDIHEGGSFSSSIRPPFGGPQRNGSYTFGDGYATDDDSSAGGSIMSRARPGEGNMLFGGRQKIYRIPVGDSGAVNTLGEADARGMRGRALYEDDVSMSTFQRLKAEEKARQREQGLAVDADIDELRKDSMSSPFAYDERRETVSSTNSGPSMHSLSTAPTSIAPSVSASSPGLSSSQSAAERQKSRKLYEQGLDQHMQEQQAAAIGRLASVKRAPSLTTAGNAPYKSRSAGNLRDRFEGGQRSGSPHLAAQRPSPSGSGRASPSPRVSNESTPASSRPLSPEVGGTERDRALFQALQPQDRGMATATGHFNRPKQFSEEQFLQRQMSLLQQSKQRGKKPSPSSTNAPSSPSWAPSSDQRQPPSAHGSRPRTGTNRTDRSWSNSSKHNEIQPVRIEKIEEHSRVPEKQEKPPAAPQHPPPPTTTPGTFLATDGDESDYEGDREEAGPSVSEHQAQAGKPEPSPRPPPPDLTHPAMRSATMPELQSTRERRQAWSPEQLKSGLAAAADQSDDYFTSRLPKSPVPPSADSSTPERNGDLKGLVREHLRHPSNSSSIYPTARTPNHEQEEFDLRVPSMYVSENPWEHDQFAPPLPKHPINSEMKLGPPPPHLADHVLRDHGSCDWREELDRHHQRGGSTETAHERRAFQSELAQRQRTIQENLRIKVENEQKSPSQSSKHVFGMLKQKPSREAMPSTRPDHPRPSTQSNNAERVPPRNRAREALGQTQPMGRTLHSRMPRQSEDGERSMPPVEISPRYPRPSMEDSRSGRGAPQARQMPFRQTPPDTSRPSFARDRQVSDAPPRDSRDRKTSSAYPRPSIDTESLRRDSGNGRSPMPQSAPPNDTSMPPFAGSNSSLDRLSPLDMKRPMPFSANSTPPLSAASTPNLTKSSSSTNVSSVVSQSSAGQREREPSIGVPTPSTGFFFPSTSGQSSAVTTPTEASNPAAGFTKKMPNTRFMNRPRKPTISKQDISEPTLITSTNAVTTVDLPAGASLQNGLRDDFDVVLFGRGSPTGPTASAPPPSIPYSPPLEAQGVAGKKKGGGFFRFGKKEKPEEDVSAVPAGDEPEPRRFRIQRLEGETGKVGHKTLRTSEEERGDGQAEPGQMSPIEGRNEASA